MFRPENAKKVNDNLTRDERICLKNMSKWNNDENSERMFRVQDKGSRLVLESKERYNELMLKYLEDKSIFREDQEDQSETNTHVVYGMGQELLL